MSKKQPIKGDFVRTKDMYEKEHTGVVDWIGAVQFAFTDQDGKRQMVHFVGSTEWNVVKLQDVG